MSRLRWRLLVTPPAPAAWNMAVDEALLQHYLLGQSLPTVRLYQWDPPAVSVGYFQQLEQAINLETCRQQGWQWVRRLTGGRAVLHFHEVTYSIVLGIDTPGLPRGVLSSYRWLAAGLLAGLQILGIEAELNGQRHQINTRSPACFASPARYELVVKGRKLVGSAQFRRQGGLLQHGSVPLAWEPELVAAACQVPTGTDRQTLAQQLAQNACGLNQLLISPVEAGAVIMAMAQGFQQVYGGEWVQQPLSPAEENTIGQLEQHYCSTGWNLGLKRQGR